MPSPSVAEVKLAIQRDGYWASQDGAMGRHVAAAHAGPYNASSRDAINMCKAVALENQFVRDVIESHFDESHFNFFRIARPTSETRLIVTDEDFRILVVTAWSRRSRATLYAGSHRVTQKPNPTKNGFLKVAPECLTDPTIQPEDFDFPNGGITIMDGRVAFDVQNGTAVCLGFMIKAELRNWLSIQVPNDLKDVMDLQTDKIKLNYTFHQDQVNCLICTVFKVMPKSQCTVCSGTGVDYQ